MPDDWTKQAAWRFADRFCQWDGKRKDCPLANKSGCSACESLREAAERALKRAEARGLREAAAHADRQTPPGREGDERLGTPANIARAIRESAAALEKEAGDGNG